MLVLLLAGCGGYDPASDNYGFGYAFDEQSASTGIRVRYDLKIIRDKASGEEVPWPQLTLAELDALYTDAAGCIGIIELPPGPLVIYAPSVAQKFGRPGYYYPESVFLDSALTGQMESDHAHHEFIHHLLYATTGNLDPNHNLNPAAWACAKV